MSLDYLSIIAEESTRLRSALLAGPLGATVPGCPEWTLGELGVHMVDVQRWSAHIVTVGVADELDHVAPDPADAAEALAESTEALLTVLRSSDPDEPCWNFGPGPQTKAFWFRRQALEVAMHRWDADSAISDTPPPLAPAVAADVIDEYLNVRLHRIVETEQIDLSRIVGDVHLHCTDLDGIDAPGEWTFEAIDGRLVVSDEHRKSAMAIKGSAGDLALFLHNRIGEESLEIFGDQEMLAAWSPAFDS